MKTDWFVCEMKRQSGGDIVFFLFCSFHGIAITEKDFCVKHLKWLLYVQVSAMKQHSPR